jgi:serine/threonine-protein kinase
MAEIYLARLRDLAGSHRHVVLKRLHPELASHPELVEMFLEEARIAKLLRHPNIVEVFDVGVVGGDYFLTMELLEGRDLRALVSTLPPGRPLPLGPALAIVRTAAGALHYTHQRLGGAADLVHRDVSPSNLFVTDQGVVKLLDFGLAQATSGAETRVTAATRGKLRYMSPEQARGERIDRRSDVFSLGLVLWELSAGRSPWGAADPLEVLRRLTELPVPPPSRWCSGYPAELEAILMCALAPRPGDRYASADQFAQALEGFVRARGLRSSLTELGELARLPRRSAGVA